MKLLLAILVALFAAVALAQPAGDRITSLPNLAGTLGVQYSGYMHVNVSRFYHYWFVQSRGSPSSDPVVLWLNGGPGTTFILNFPAQKLPPVILTNSFILQDAVV